MALYVLALTDQPLPRTSIAGRRYESIRSGPVFAVVERRAHAPRPDDRELLRQHRAVVKLFAQSQALLPVRFGALLERADLDAAIRSREDGILQSLNDVRGRAQMTLRIIGRPRRSVPAAKVVSGREYLERKRSATVDLPRWAVRLLARLAPLVAREQRAPGTGPLLATVYHLVDVPLVEPYLAIVHRHARPGLMVSGPWPPFAFAPQVS